MEYVLYYAPIKTKQPDNKNQALSKTALMKSQTLSHQCGNIRNDRQALKQTEDESCFK